MMKKANKMKIFKQTKNHKVKMMEVILRVKVRVNEIMIIMNRLILNLSYYIDI